MTCESTTGRWNHSKRRAFGKHTSDIGKTTAEMETGKTFLDAGWDFIDGTANGTEDIWWILEGKDCPRLWWEATTE